MIDLLLTEGTADRTAPAVRRVASRGGWQQPWRDLGYEWSEGGSVGGCEGSVNHKVSSWVYSG